MRLIISAKLLFSLLLMTAIAHSTEVSIKGDAVNLRKGPGTTYEIAGKGAYGDKLTVIGQEKNWLKVTTAGKNGNFWIYKPLTHTKKSQSEKTRISAQELFEQHERDFDKQEFESGLIAVYKAAKKGHKKADLTLAGYLQDVKNIYNRIKYAGYSLAEQCYEMGYITKSYLPLNGGLNECQKQINFYNAFVETFELPFDSDGKQYIGGLKG